MTTTTTSTSTSTYINKVTHMGLSPDQVWFDDNDNVVMVQIRPCQLRKLSQHPEAKSIKFIRLENGNPEAKYRLRKYLAKAKILWNKTDWESWIIKS